MKVKGYVRKSKTRSDTTGIFWGIKKGIWYCTEKQEQMYIKIK
jgi:hypothetical protein